MLLTSTVLYESKSSSFDSSRTCSSGIAVPRGETPCLNGVSVSIEPIDRRLTTNRERKRLDRCSRLDELTRQAQEDGLYDVEADAYYEALVEARKS